MDDLIKKALGLQMNGFIKEAIGIYEKAIKKDPENVMIAEYYGAVLAQAGQFNEAKFYLKKALRKSVEKPINKRYRIQNFPY